MTSDRRAPAPTAVPGPPDPQDAGHPDVVVDGPYSARLGERLVAVRRLKRLTRLDVSRMSNGEFKASVLGSYERGERAMPFPRLCSLAELYGVSPNLLLPLSETNVAGVAVEATRQRIVIQVPRLPTMSGTSYEGIATYVRSLQVRRQDFAGAVVTLRGSDAGVFAAMMSMPRRQLIEGLESLDVLAS